MAGDSTKKRKRQTEEVEEEEPEEEQKQEGEKKKTGTEDLTLYRFVRECVGNKILAIFGDTRTGKTTFCMSLAVECASLYKSHVIYIDTEGNIPSKLEHENIEYVEVETAQELQDVIASIYRERKSNPPALLIVDSISMPVLREDARASGLAERGMVQRTLISLISDIKKLCKALNMTAVVVMHPVSTMTLSRILESVVKRLEQNLQQSGGRKRRISIEELPEEIKLMYWKPVGGKALFDIKEIWLTHVAYRGKLSDLANSRGVEPEVLNKLEKVLPSLDVPVTKTIVYASESRRFPKLEKLVSMYITSEAIVYKIHVEPRPWRQPKILQA